MRLFCLLTLFLSSLSILTHNSHLYLFIGQSYNSKHTINDMNVRHHFAKPKSLHHWGGKVTHEVSYLDLKSPANTSKVALIFFCLRLKTSKERGTTASWVTCSTAPWMKRLSLMTTQNLPYSNLWQLPLVFLWGLSAKPGSAFSHLLSSYFWAPPSFLLSLLSASSSLWSLELCIKIFQSHSFKFQNVYKLCKQVSFLFSWPLAGNYLMFEIQWNTISSSAAKKFLKILPAIKTHTESVSPELTSAQNQRTWERCWGFPTYACRKLC